MINLLSNDVWSEADIMAHGRAVINSQVSVERQDELRTIMLGHIAQMRVASPEELAEIGLVQAITEAQVIANAQARADNALLASVLAYEAALVRLAQPVVTEPLTVIVDEAEVPNEAIAQDVTERNEAQALILLAPQEVYDLYDLRHPVEVVAPDA